MASPPRSLELAMVVREVTQRVLQRVRARAVPEQQRLTVQLARNSFYFTLSCLLIRIFGDQLAV